MVRRGGCSLTPNRHLAALGGLPSGLSYAGGAFYPDNPDDLGSEAHPWGGLVLAQDGAISAVNAAADGLMPWFQKSSFVNGMDTYDTLLIADQMLYDPDYGEDFFFFADRGIVFSDQARADYDGDSQYNHAYTTMASKNIQLRNSLGHQMVHFQNTVDVLYMVLNALPASDPAAQENQCFTFIGDAAALATFLSGGGKLLALSPTP